MQEAPKLTKAPLAGCPEWTPFFHDFIEQSLQKVRQCMEAIGSVKVHLAEPRWDYAWGMWAGEVW